MVTIIVSYPYPVYNGRPVDVEITKGRTYPISDHDNIPDLYMTDGPHIRIYES